LQGATRSTSSTSFTDTQFGNGARREKGFLVLCKIGRLAVRWSRPLAGPLKTVTISREADGWSVSCSCADVLVHCLPPTGPQTGQETGRDLGREAVATRSAGTRLFSPGWSRQAERALKTAQRRVSRRLKGSHRRRKGVTVAARRSPSWPRRSSKCAASEPTFSIRRPSRWCVPPIRSPTKTYRRPICSRTSISLSHSPTRAGRSS
jgi:hypothetical protein